jgi:hypothetical protein
MRKDLRGNFDGSWTAREQGASVIVEHRGQVVAVIVRQPGPIRESVKLAALGLLAVAWGVEVEQLMLEAGSDR